jgi:hypothetical protein
MPQQKAVHQRRQQDLQRKAAYLKRQVVAELCRREQGELRQQVSSKQCLERSSLFVCIELVPMSQCLGACMPDLLGAGLSCRC